MTAFVLAVAVGFPTPNRADAADVKDPITLEGHSGSVLAVTFLGDGKILASVGGDKTVRLWSVAEGKEIRVLKGHGAEVMSVVGTPDGKTLASGDKNGVVKVWDTATGKELLTLKGQKGDTASLLFSPDGKTLAVGGGDFDKEAKKSHGEIRLWDLATGKAITVIDCAQHRVFALAYSADGSVLASCSSDGSVILWEAATGRKKSDLGKNPQGGASLAFSPDGKTLACGSFFGEMTIKFWDVTTGKETRTIAPKGNLSVFALKYLPDGKTLVVGGFHQDGLRDPASRGAYVGLWDIEGEKERTALTGHSRGVLSVSINRDGTRLAASGLDSNISVWELPKQK
jgi:WD40 repeat protein